MTLPSECWKLTDPISRIQIGGKPFRVLYAFNPKRTAILLIGGDKTGDERWYEINVPKADKLYDRHLEELKEEGRTRIPVSLFSSSLRRSWLIAKAGNEGLRQLSDIQIRRVATGARREWGVQEKHKNIRRDEQQALQPAQGESGK